MVGPIGLTPLEVADMVPFRVPEIVPDRVPEMVPFLVPEIVPDFANVVVETARANMTAQAMDWAVFISPPGWFRTLGNDRLKCLLDEPA